MNTQEQITTDTPLTLLMDKEEHKNWKTKETPEEQLASFLTQSLHWMVEQNANDMKVVIFSVLYALKDPYTLELTQRERAKELGISYGLIPHYKGLFEKEMNI